MIAWQNELLALTPGDFNFKRGTVTINKFYQRLHGKDIITAPKTKKANRTIQMPDFLCAEMKDSISSLYGIGKHDRLFPITKSYLHHEMNRGCEQAAVKTLGAYCLTAPDFGCILVRDC